MRFITKVTLIIHVLCLCLFTSIEPFPRVMKNPILTNSANFFKDNKPKAFLSDTEFYADSDVCQTTDCQNTGKALKANLNTSVDPCDDFYEFVCGKWTATQTIPHDLPLYDKHQETIVIIKKKINDTLKEVNPRSEPRPVVFASVFYKSCLDGSSRQEEGIKPLKKTLDLIGGWPLISGSFNETVFNWEEMFVKMIMVFGHTPIFTFDISQTPNINRTMVNILSFDSNNLGMGLNLGHTNNSEVVSAYKQLLLRTALLFGAKNNSQTTEQIEELLDFCIEFEKIKQESIVKQMSLKEMTNLTDNRVDWIKLMNNIYEKLNSSVRVSSEELVVVSDINYYKNVTNLLNKTSKRTLANLFNYFVVNSYRMYTTIDQDNNRAINWSDCFELVKASFPDVVSRLFVESSLSKEDKQVASVLVNDIKDSFNERLKINTWLDSTTKNNALVKLNAIKNNVGYPDWILNNTLLDQYYDLTRDADPKKFFDNILHLKERATIKLFNSLRKTPEDTSFMAPEEVNGYYSALQNTITITAGILTPPEFDSKLPGEINYGAIGVLVGHELTHGFDSHGSQYDQNGKRRNWWSEGMSKMFKQKSKCFVKQYSSYLETQTGIHLNGTNTLDEDIADHGGVREAYGAYIKYVQRHGKQRLPSISDYSAEQQFFISFANSWCTKYQTDYLKKMMNNPRDGHSPAKYRVNIPLSNFKTFSDVFKCSTNSRMNEKNKCILW